MARAALRDPAPRVTLVLSLTVKNVDSIGFVVRKCSQSTSDQGYLDTCGYLDTWSFSALTPEQQLTNAPHYEAVAEMWLGLRTDVAKPRSEARRRLSVAPYPGS